jgi:aspartate racemase
MHSHTLAEYVRRIELDDWQGVANLMLASAEKLAASGADFLICPDNTIHEAFPRLEARSPLPWLHIAEVVADAAAERGYRRIGVVGTRWLVGSDVYPQKLNARGLECVRPTGADCEVINHIIMDELVKGVVSASAVACFQRVFAGMKDDRCDAVVLGCTEIPLAMTDSNSPLPTLDSTRLLASAALKAAIRD